ncbi:aspartyl-phosphate phosphatase Spo0E family protein [Metabacillus herbersteinensis]|uniref:Aspartyl-phosphate phosphatase Spo0E family protein n=1 Tax=Metabacillus herbersteinensis TaxID=283816 RepID=A0ABV6GAH1_9BACI
MKPNSLKVELLESINEKRQEMISTAETNGYTNEAVVHCSQELDRLLNKYQQLLLEETYKTTTNPFQEFVNNMKKWTFRDRLVYQSAEK